MELSELNQALSQSFARGEYIKAAAYCSERIAGNPEDYKARELLAFILGNAGRGTAAFQILKSTAEFLVRKGFVIAAIGIVRKGMEQTPNDEHWRNTLLRLHVRAARHQVAKVRTPPPLPPTHTEGDLAVTAAQLLELSDDEILSKAIEVGTNFPAAGEEMPPSALPLFSELDSESFIALVQHSNYVRLKAGEAFITEGEVGHSLFVVVDGQVEVVKDGKSLVQLGSGTVVGEMALLTNTPRTATVKATGECELFEVPRELLDTLTEQAPRIREDLIGYCRNRLLDNILRTSPLFSRFDESGRMQLLKLFQRKPFREGEVILQEGQSSVGLFLVAAGQVSISALDEAGENVNVATLNVGDVFGEISLLKERPVTATVTAAKQTGTLFLPRELFQQLLAQYPEIGKELESLSEERIKATKEATELEELTDIMLI